MTELKRAGLIKATKAEVDAAQYTTEYIDYDIEVYMSYGNDVDYSDPDLYCYIPCYLIDGVWYYELQKTEDNNYILSKCNSEMIERLLDHYDEEACKPVRDLIKYVKEN